MGNSSVEYRGESDRGVPAAGSLSRFPQPALPVIYFCVTDPSFHGEFANYISGLHGVYKRKKATQFELLLVLGRGIEPLLQD